MVRRFIAGLWLVACNVPEPPSGQPPVGLVGDFVGCPRGLVVANSDYQSTSVSLITPDGDVLSPSLVSTGSATAGLSQALSGDVVLPTERAPSGRVVLIDRYPNSVLTWLDVRSARVLSQLSVGTGFASNPHDYIEVDVRRAYVSRYETNPVAGRAPFDEGGDLLIVDTERYAITGRVPLGRPDDGDILPRPDRMAYLAGDIVAVVLQRFDRGFHVAGDARVVGVDSARDAVAWSLDLPGLRSCSVPVRSPSGARVAVPCSGTFRGNQLATSALVLLDATASPPRELARFDVAKQLGAAVGPSIAFATEDQLLGTTYGSAQPAAPDGIFVLDVATGRLSNLARASSSFVLGDVRCAPGCSALCIVTDAEQGSVRRFRRTSSGSFESLPPVRPDTVIGLPPRYLGPF